MADNTWSRNALNAAPVLALLVPASAPALADAVDGDPEKGLVIVMRIFSGEDMELAPHQERRDGPRRTLAPLQRDKLKAVVYCGPRHDPLGR